MKREVKLGHKTRNYKVEFYEMGRETIVRKYYGTDYVLLLLQVRQDKKSLCADSASVFEERTTDGTYSVWYYNETLK